MKKAMIVSLLLLFGLMGYSEEIANVIINLKTAKAEYILGEEINFEYQAINNGDKEFRVAYGGFSHLSTFMRFGTIGPTRKECNTGRPLAEWGGKGYYDFKGGEKSKVESFSHLQIGIVDKGEYEVWVEYNSTYLDSSWNKDSVPRTVIQSNHIKFRIINPTGIDLEVYNKYHNSCNQITLTLQDLLQKFPTSTYAGYELAKNADEDLVNYVNLTSDEIIDDVLGVRWRPDRDSYKEEVKAKYKEQLKMLQNFILVHPDFAKADMIHSAMTRCLLILGRQNEAIEEMKVLSKMEGRFAEGARRALEKVGQVKSEPKASEEIKKKENATNPVGKKE